MAADLERDRAAVERQCELRPERARYEAARAFRQQLRDGKLIAYRAHICDHWEWRVSCAVDQPLPSQSP